MDDLQGQTELKECGPDIILRDFFAGCVLAGLMAFGHSAVNKKGKGGSDSTAWAAYQMSDAMLKAREEAQ